MYPITNLEWLHDGEWKQIGWTASDPRSTADLREHGERLAGHGGNYRLVTASVYAGHAANVIHEWHEATI